MEQNINEVNENTENLVLGNNAEEEELNMVLVGTVTGLGIGLSAGIMATAGVWFYERNKRLKVLHTLENVMNVAAAKNKGETKLKTGKKFLRKEKEIEIENIDISSAMALAGYVEEQMKAVKLKTKEKERWQRVISELVKEAVIKGKQEALDEELVIEEFEDKDNKKKK